MLFLPAKYLKRMWLKQICWPAGAATLFLGGWPRVTHFSINRVIVKTAWANTDIAPGTKQEINKFMLTNSESTPSSRQTWYQHGISRPSLHHLTSSFPVLRTPASMPPTLFPNPAFCCTGVLTTSSSCTKLLVCPISDWFPLWHYFHPFTKQPCHQIIYFSSPGFAPAVTHPWKQLPRKFLPL